MLEQTGIDVCYVLEFTPDMSKLTAQEFMQYILKQHCGVDRLVIGYDHRFGRNRSEGFEDYERYGSEIGIDVIQAEGFIYKGQPISSSLIRRYLHEGNVHAADLCLRYPYFLNGHVVSGYQVGRKIGFPTANLQINDPAKVVPEDGV